MPINGRPSSPLSLQSSRNASPQTAVERCSYAASETACKYVCCKMPAVCPVRADKGYLVDSIHGPGTNTSAEDNRRLHSVDPALISTHTHARTLWRHGCRSSCSQQPFPDAARTLFQDRRDKGKLHADQKICRSLHGVVYVAPPCVAAPLRVTACVLELRPA